MDPAVAALIGIAIGAFAGLVGAGFAAVASIRASQLAARAPLAGKLHGLARAFVNLSKARRTADADEDELANLLQIAWNDLFTHQRILCPSERLQAMGTLFYEVALTEQVSSQAQIAAILVLGKAQETIARMVAAYSNNLFRWMASYEECNVLQEFLDGPDAQRLPAHITARLRSLC